MAIKTFIQNCKDNNIDLIAKTRFKRFSVGDFPREPIYIKIMSKGSQVQTGFEYAPDLILLTIDMLGEDHKFQGEALLTAAKSDPKEDVSAAKFKIKLKKGKKYTLEFDLSGKELKEAIKTLGAKYALLFPKFTADDNIKLKMKGSPPKPGSLKEKFCTLKVTKEHTETLLQTFMPEIKDHKFKKATINIVFNIKDAIIPKEYENDLALARLHAKKQGTISRTIEIDGKEAAKEEFNFEA